MRHDSFATKSSRSVFRYVLARGIIVLLVVVGLGVLATASVYQRAQSERVLINEALPVFVSSVRLYANANALAGLSVRMLAVETRSELRTLSDRIVDRSRAIIDDIDLLEAQGLGLEEGRRVRKVHAELMDGADTLAGMIEQILATQKAGNLTDDRLADLVTRRDQLVQRQEMVTSELTTLVSGLSRQMELQVEAHRQETVRSAQYLVVTVAGASFVAVLAVLAVYLGLRRHMLARLQGLTVALRDWRAGGEARLPVDGHGDEITELSASVHDLIRAVNHHTAELTTQAVTDPLTGMLNRRGFEDRSSEEVLRTARYAEPLSVLFGDIDHFKPVNDTHGHAAGDIALRHTASLWRGSLRDIDISGRLGGEEFAALLPHTDTESALVVAERIRDDVAHSAVLLDDGTRLTLTISIGVAQLAPGESLDDLLSRADRALYGAKMAGRNRVVADASGTADTTVSPTSQVW